MRHIQSHFDKKALSGLMPHLHPDWFLIDHLLKTGLMSRKDYAYVTEYTKQPQIRDGMLLPLGTKVATVVKDRRMERVPYDLRREDRQMRKEKERGKRKSDSRIRK